MDFVFATFGKDKHLGTALRCFEGIANRRAWDAFCFCIHPKHDGNRDRMGVDVQFTAFLVGYTHDESCC